MDDSMLRDRFRGAIVGTAIGDALGAPFEGRSRVNAGELDAWERSSATLRWTDDTHMTIGVAESLIATGGFDGDDMVDRFMRHYAAEPWRGYGAGPPMVFAAVREGAHWRDAAAQLFGGRGSFGNGAAMRSAPIGLFSCHDLDQAVSIARDAAGLTHAHELARQGAAVQAYATGWLATAGAQHGRWRPDRLLDDLREVAPDPVFQQRIDAIARIAADAAIPDVVDALGNSITASESVPAAVHAALRHRQSFADTVRYAVTLGGDTDTIAAMAGALSGALLGHSSLPREWVGRLEAGDRLVRLADELHARAEDAAAPSP